MYDKELNHCLCLLKESIVNKNETTVSCLSFPQRRYSQCISRQHGKWTFLFASDGAFQSVLSPASNSQLLEYLGLSVCHML